MHEELEYAGVSDFSYSVNDLKIDSFGEIAVTTFTLDEKGILVNTYTFEATPLSKTSRVTMVLKKDKGEWKVLHEHFSQKVE
jgi:ketosteroid isomerase-like protein